MGWQTWPLSYMPQWRAPIKVMQLCRWAHQDLDPGLQGPWKLAPKLKSIYRPLSVTVDISQLAEVNYPATTMGGQL